MPRRRLTPAEIAEAMLVFGAGFDYTRAQVVEEAAWPDWIDALGARLQKRTRHKDEHNAVTLGGTSYFPVKLRTDPESVTGGFLRDIGWLMHELTHQWQHQRLGWSYLTSALRVQLRDGRRAYDYRREHPTLEAALQAALSAGLKLASFNPEQQGDLVRDYYFRLKQRQEVGPWEPFIAEFRGH
jgi:type VI secretion system secreted protein VgrG